MNASAIVIGVAVVVAGLGLKLVVSDASASRTAQDNVNAQSLYAVAGMMRDRINDGYVVPDGLTPVNNAPMPSWFSTPSDAEIFLLRHGDHEYVVGRYTSQGMAARVFSVAEGLAPGVPYRVVGNDIRRNLSQGGASPAPPGLQPVDVVVKVDARL